VEEGGKGRKGKKWQTLAREALMIIIRWVIPKFLIKSCSFLTRAICQPPPPSSQAGAGLAAVHSPALHNKAASQPPPPLPLPRATSQPLHHDTVTPAEEMARGQSCAPRFRDTDAHAVLLLREAPAEGQVNEVMQCGNCSFASLFPWSRGPLHLLNLHSNTRAGK